MVDFVRSYLKNHKLLVIASFILALIIVQSNMLYAAALFWLVGEIPGSNWSVPPAGMAIGIAMIVALLVTAVVRHSLADADSKLRDRHLPRRRYAHQN